jgi:hypothetical protein
MVREMTFYDQLAQYFFPFSATADSLFSFADTSYDYAVPEMGTMPLLSPENTLPLPMVASAPSDKDSVFSKGSSSKGSKSEDSKGKKVSQL